MTDLQNPFLERGVKRILYRLLFITLPKSYKREAIELIKEDNRTDIISVFLDYFIGGIGYRARKLLIAIVSFLQSLVAIPFIGEKRKIHIPSTEREVT